MDVALVIDYVLMTSFRHPLVDRVWCKEVKEFLTFPDPCPTRVESRKRERRHLKPFSQSFSGPQETQQSNVRTQESSWTVVNYQKNLQSWVRFQKNPSPEEGSQRSH